MDLNSPKFIHDLVGLVKEYQCLYVPKSPDYRNQFKKIQAWREIGEKLSVPAPRCKAKWKALRDQFVRETKRLQNATLDTARWKYYNNLKFIRSYLFPVRCPNYRGKARPETDCEHTKIEYYADIINNSDENFQNLDCSTMTTTTSTNQYSSIKKSSNIQEITEPDHNEDIVQEVEGEGELETEEDPFIEGCKDGTTELIQDEAHDESFKIRDSSQNEVDAFFKSISLKIKNAGLTPHDLIDLQIQILQVISDKLRIIEPQHEINFEYTNHI